VTRSLSGFDDWLNRLLERCAYEAGENVETYVARAVASQMLAEQRIADSGLVEEMTAHMALSPAFAEPSMPSVLAALTEPDRLRALYASGLLDSPPEEAYDRITRAAAAALDAPTAAISLVDVDRQFFKSSFGMKIESAADRQTPLERSVCQYAVASGTPLILEDARADPVFRNHPAVRDGTVAAYLGIPLIDDDGNAVGTLCVFDSKPRMWGTGHLQILSDLAKIAAGRIFASKNGANN
jgi:GAF domain-containing protein